ncbi:MAG TPA: NUDIX hydrolase [Syntrophales bacterium]|nr:NUDIX hydrolase [Syntrophales bacterium]
MVSKTTKKCAKCGAEMQCYRNPFPTVDIIIELDNQGIILISRKNYPFGWALPGGFVDYGESLEDAAIREAKEEAGLDVKLIGQFHTYSRPDRDPRHHSISTVYIAKASGTPRAADDAKEVGIFTKDALPSPIAFDHKEILDAYFSSRG